LDGAPRRQSRNGRTFLEEGAHRQMPDSVVTMGEGDVVLLRLEGGVKERSAQ